MREKKQERVRRRIGQEDVDAKHLSLRITFICVKDFSHSQGVQVRVTQIAENG